MWTILISAALTGIATAEVRVESLGGEVVSGHLTGITESELKLIVSGQDKSLPFSMISTVTSLGQKTRYDTKPSSWIDLVDGSSVQARQFTESSGTAVATLLDDNIVEVPTNYIRAVRLRAATPDLEDQWKEILAQRFGGDTLVLRRPGPVLDYIEGTLGTVTQETVNFALDGETIPVPRDRVEGFLYFSAAEVGHSTAFCTARDSRGNTWQAVKLDLADNRFVLTTAVGVTIAVPVDRFESLDFAGGNVFFLSDLEPIRVRWTPFVTSAGVSDQLEQLYRPRINSGFDGGKLRLHLRDGSSRIEEFDKGFAVHSRTELVFRLPEEFRRLTGVVGINDQMRQGGTTLLQVSGEDGTLLREKITSSGPPRTIDVDVSGVRRLTVLVDFADGLAIADQLNLCNFKLTK